LNNSIKPVICQKKVALVGIPAGWLGSDILRWKFARTGKPDHISAVPVPI
jgi:hypothetical protein